MASLVRASSFPVAAASAPASRRPSGAAGLAPQHRAQHQEWTGRVVEATVKWFDPAKGFGFVTVDRLGDVFFHVSVVGDHNRPSLLRQTRLRVRLGPGPKTLQVTEIIDRLPVGDGGVPSFSVAGAAAQRGAAAVPEPCAFPF
jgi:CspA family cold shock protein